ncbi:hypothetical protein GCM10007169_08470 [Shewanella fodinae]|nr:hypothetical protein GCM10007169_08470 [Shewanella fodinae]
MSAEHFSVSKYHVPTNNPYKYHTFKYFVIYAKHYYSKDRLNMAFFDSKTSNK